MSATQINTLIAYRSDGDCECIPCRACDGQGEFTSYVAGGYFSARGLQREYQFVQTCSACHGTGKDTGDCAIHEPREQEDPGGAFDSRYSISAEDLGIEDESVCDACNAGDHDLPKLAPCSCACHGHRRAA